MADRTLEQYVDLGNLSAACMTRPETCETGGTVTLWVKLLEVGGFQGIITSLDIPRSDGFTFYLSDSLLGYVCQITSVISSFEKDFVGPTKSIETFKLKSI